jgi:beta-glucuronidase
MLYPQLNEFRSTTSLDGLWDFRFQWPGDGAAGWENGFGATKRVPVPCSFNDLFTTYSERNHWGPVWYQRRVRVPDFWRGRRIVLRFGAASYRADVWVNGHFLGSHETGHTPFEFEAGPHFHAGDNVIVARVDTRLTPETVPPGELSMPGTAIHMGNNKPPGNFDFFPYGGIQRPVVLYTTPPDFLESVLVDASVREADAEVVFRVGWRGAADALRITIEETAENAEIALTGTPARCEVAMASPRLWSPDNPHLYHARIELLRGGNVLDCYRQRFGIRTVEIRGGKFLLNGRPFYFKGFGRHEDFPLSGRGHNPAADVRDFELMSWIGANSFRTSHYPYSEEQLDMADEQGILVISESPAVGIVPDLATERTLAVHCAVQREYMLRDHNHPSVVMWSVANEPLSSQPSARAYFEKVVHTARDTDPSRPVTMVTCNTLQDACLDLLDVVCVNAYPGWYGGGDPFSSSVAGFADYLAKVHEYSGGRPVLVTEFGADSIAGFHMLPSELWTEDYQEELVARLIVEIRKCPYAIGEHVWAMCDFRTGQNDRRALGNRKGVFTRDRQPKSVAHTLRRIWRAGD